MTTTTATRRKRRKRDDATANNTLDDAASSEGGDDAPRNVERIELGGRSIDAWYFSPFPEPYADAAVLFFCDFCLRYFSSRRAAHAHRSVCEVRCPPGDEIYRTPEFSIFMIEGKGTASRKTYCQNLCLLSKLFLDHKTLCYDVEPFTFFVLVDGDGQLIGYFSKERDHTSLSLACITTLPPYQGRGYGGLLVDLSYVIARRRIAAAYRDGREDDVDAIDGGSPERPLSDLGELQFRSYWVHTLTRALLALAGGGSIDGKTAATDREAQRRCSVLDVVRATGIRSGDVVLTLKRLGLVRADATASARRAHEVVTDVSALAAWVRANARDVRRVDESKLTLPSAA